MLLLAFILALIWGILWASFLQLTRYGHYLALRRTWLTVVVGVGVDLLILLAVMPVAEWVNVCGIIAASSIGIIARSLHNEVRDERAVHEVQNG